MKVQVPLEVLQNETIHRAFMDLFSRDGPRLFWDEVPVQSFHEPEDATPFLELAERHVASLHDRLDRFYRRIEPARTAGPSTFPVGAPRASARLPDTGDAPEHKSDRETCIDTVHDILRARGITVPRGVLRDRIVTPDEFARWQRERPGEPVRGVCTFWAEQYVSASGCVDAFFTQGYATFSEAARDPDLLIRLRAQQLEHGLNTVKALWDASQRRGVYRNIPEWHAVCTGLQAMMTDVRARLERHARWRELPEQANARRV
ncbi:MAG: hypothetical protein EB027_07900, partial [Actinobacteria bacterium]|nr:hypothetical protein [Actinomycetota bacterium]